MSAPTIPQDGFMRQWDVIGRKGVTKEQSEANQKVKAPHGKGRKPKRLAKRPREAVQGVLPMSASAWWAGIKQGRYPAPVKLGPGLTAWKAEDVRALVDRIASQGRAA